MTESTTELRPPVAKKVPQERTHHGDTFVDDYEWLRDKESADTVAYLESENAYTEQQTAHLADLREQIFTEIRTRTQETDLSVPARLGDWWYYTRTVEGQQYALHCRTAAPSSDQPDAWDPPVLEAGRDVPGEQVLLDGNQLAEGHEFFSLGTFSVSPDGHLLAFSTDYAGDERYTLRVKDLRTGEMLGDEVPNTVGGATWDLGATTLFYSTVDDAWRPDKVWRHTLGTDASQDVVVFHEPDERYWTGVGRSRSDRYLMVVSGSKTTTEYRVLEADDPTGEFRVVAPRRQGVEYSVEHAVVAGEDRFVILHNDNAENFELADAPVGSPTPEHWRPVVPHSPGERLEDVDAFATHLVVSQRRKGLTELRIVPLTADGYGEGYLVEFEEPLYTVGVAGNPEFGQPTVRLGYTSLVTPASVYDYDVRTHDLLLRKRTPVLGGFDPADYEQHREWATAGDGTAVPISLVCRKGTPRDGSAPMVLYGYGSYEISSDPAFGIPRLSLLDRGIVFAIAHVRGGGEMGRHWYDDGKVLHKKNTFTDFVDCARHVVDRGWTSPQRLVAHGGSAGGLLVGAVANMAPDSFAGIVAEVPFVDPLTSILDPSLPLTVIEWEEWGNPLQDPEVYAYMRSYS
ncbi:MAG: S9 family peptidase, partial [Actinomycetota bacterium]|nr:S9 family peptidase [Actinomycetota bacterium]